MKIQLRQNRIGKDGVWNGRYKYLEVSVEEFFNLVKNDKLDDKDSFPSNKTHKEMMKLKDDYEHNIPIDPEVLNDVILYFKSLKLNTNMSKLKDSESSLLSIRTRLNKLQRDLECLNVFIERNKDMDPMIMEVLSEKRRNIEVNIEWCDIEGCEQRIEKLKKENEDIINEVNRWMEPVQELVNA